jgi:hypothetical protein
MSRQYFEDTLVDPPLANLTAISATTETVLWPVAQYSPINIGDMRAGKIYKVSAGGIYSTGASGTLILTPRFGTSTAGITMGANAADTVPVSMTNVPWFLEFVCVMRTIGLAGTNSTVIGTGKFIGSTLGATAGIAHAFSFGGTSATVDATIAQGLAIGWTLSVAGSVTPEWVTMQSLN